jgi:hypothetical protein
MHSFYAKYPDSIAFAKECEFAASQKENKIRRNELPRPCSRVMGFRMTPEQQSKIEFFFVREYLESKFFRVSYKGGDFFGILWY